MGFTSRDMFAECDSEMFARARRRSGLAQEALAVEAEKELRAIARTARRQRRGDGVPETVSKQLVGQLERGESTTTHELRGIAFERALGVPEGSIFAPVVVRGVRSAKRRVVA